jgi:hypothetical protein
LPNEEWPGLCSTFAARHGIPVWRSEDMKEVAAASCRNKVRLELCDGTRTKEEIIAHILPRHTDPALACDVREFLEAARRRGWIIES